MSDACTCNPQSYPFVCPVWGVKMGPKLHCVCRGECHAEQRDEYIARWQAAAAGRSQPVGPGTELKALIEQLGIKPDPTCDCRRLALEMDQWGVDGCRERRPEIVDRIKVNRKRWGWGRAFGRSAFAALKAVTSGLAFQLDPRDPIGSLVDLAIARAAAQQTAVTLPAA